jgi:hypothetical protein
MIKYLACWRARNRTVKINGGLGKQVAVCSPYLAQHQMEAAIEEAEEVRGRQI